MTKPRSALPIVVALIAIAIISVMVDFSGVLKTQLLQTPETLSTLKLVKQETDPVQFDIYYDELTNAKPEDVSIVIANVIIQQGTNYKNLTQMTDSVLLNSGQQSLVTASDNQTLTIRNIQTRASTKLGTIKTFLKRSEYISLEYDTIVNRKRVTLFDHPVPSDFPLGYHQIQNPTNELLYIRTPEFHAILGDSEKAFAKVQEVPVGALLMANKMTTMQPLDGLNNTTLTSQPLVRVTPQLLVEQNQIVVPKLEEGDLNTLIIRYRLGNNPWSISSFYLPSNQDITLPVPTKNLLDFYTEVEYSFANIGSGYNTLNLDYPYNSLLPPNQFPVYYRTDYVSLAPELLNAQKSLELSLHVNIAPEANAIAIGILSRDPIYSLRDAVQKLQQKLPIVIFQEDAETFTTTVTKPDQLPYFNLIGQHDQIWNRRVTDPNFDLISKSFKRIPLLGGAQQVPTLEMVNQTKGDRLICLLKTKNGSTSLSPLSSDLMLTSSCLLSARRAGYTVGTLFPLVFKADKQQFLALTNYDFDDSLSDQQPSIKSYDPIKKTIALNNVFTTEKVMLLASPTPQFEESSNQPVELVDINSLKIPALPSCTIACYFKIASIIRQDDKVVLGYASDTMMIAATPLPVVQLCFANQPFVDKLYDPAQLKFQIMITDATPIDMTFDKTSGCYQYIVGGDLGASTTPSTVPATFNSTPVTPASPTPPVVPAAPTAPATSTTPTTTPPPAPSTTTSPAPVTPKTTTLVPAALAQTTPAPAALNLTLNDLFTSLPSLPAKTIVFHTNGLTNNHILIPPQRHYLAVKNDSIQQILVTDLVFEHLHLETLDQPQTDAALKQSYQMTVLGKDTHLFARSRGNIIIQTLGDTPTFQKFFDTASPLNETILFPGGKDVLSLPNTIRLLASDDVIIQGFQEPDKVLSLALPVPERSSVRLFLENVFRPKVQVKQLINEGITYDPATNFMTLENPTGTMSIPLQVSISKPTDASSYASTFPPTPVPDDIDLASFTLRLALHVEQPADIPNTSVIDPINLDHADPGIAYEAQVSFGGIENSASFEIGDGRFYGQECAQVLKFNKKDRTITGQLSADTQLTACYYEVSVKYLVKIPYAQIEVTTLRTYRIPVLVNPDATKPVAEPVEVAISTKGDRVNEVIALAVPLEELVETTPQYLDKGSQAGLISALGNLTIVFDAVNQKIVIGGTGELLLEPTTRYVRAIRQDTGDLVLLALNFVPIKRQEIILPINQDFPNVIDVPVILRDQGFTDEDLATLKVVTDSLSVTADVSPDNKVSIYGLPELQNQVFSAVLEKQSSTPSALLEFASKVKNDTAPKEPSTIHVDFKLQLNQPQTVTTDAIALRAGKDITIDLSRFISDTSNLVINQLPSFLSQQGAQLTGTAPAVPQDLNLLIQDYSSVTNIIVPLKITADGSSPATPSNPSSPSSPSNPSTTTHQAPGDCFPDLTGQPKEIIDSICLAKQYGIVSGSNGFFKPNDPINRAEVSKILVTGPLVIFGLLKEIELLNLGSNFPQQHFPDVPSSAWYYGYVETAREVSIVEGNPDGSFRPAASLNNAEAAKMIVSTLKELQPSSFTGTDDVTQNTLRGDAWYAPYVRILNRNGGDLADPAQADHMSQPISRAEFIYNLLILLDSKAKDIMAKISTTSS